VWNESPAWSPATATVFTGSIEAIDAVSRTFETAHVVCEFSRATVEISDAAALVGARLHVVRTERELHDLTIAADVGIAFGFGVIFSRRTIERFPAGIWNIHPGKLPEYRSRHAIGWAMIEGEREIGIAVHQIDEEIDRGQLIFETSAPRFIWDSFDDVVTRTRRMLPDVVREARNRFTAGSLRPIARGRYLPRIDCTFADVDPALIDSRTLFNLVLTERSHNGVRVRGRRFERCHFFRDGICDGGDGGVVVTCRDGVSLVLYE
jgi:folate-dependent phosphoribosylglycinamide formyltransferase PurN